VCLRKLSTAIIGFKVSDWLSNMRTACEELGFDEDVQFYDRLIFLESDESEIGAKRESNNSC
jgi:hypothetical protein